MVRSLGLIALAIPLASCDWAARYDFGTPLANYQSGPSANAFQRKLPHLMIESVFADIKNLLTDSNSHWPADGGNYGPLFVRLAWHCSGSYRISDGRGGCTGGNQRFEPVRSWDDNTNLDKARALLTPIKRKYGDKLSWGDLIIAAGTTSIREMGGPVAQMCFGRLDFMDSTPSLDLGPSPEQERDFPCAVDGQCQPPLGTTTVGLIYLNPEGPVVEPGGSPVPDPALSALDIRDAFSRMGQDDRATVALIGGGHAFGKTHGACSVDGAQGLRPSEAYAAGEQTAWQGKCGEGHTQGKGDNTFTSGFEGPWTTHPDQWDNEFYRWLLDREWEKFIGPGGHWQWRVKDATASEIGVMRLTSDVALLHDDKYLELVKEFASDLDALGTAFSDAWFTLTHRGGGFSPDTHCDQGTVPQWVLEQNDNRMLDSDSVVV